MHSLNAMRKIHFFKIEEETICYHDSFTNEFSSHVLCQKNVEKQKPTTIRKKKNIKQNKRLQKDEKLLFYNE